MLTHCPLDSAVILEAVCNRSKDHLAKSNAIYRCVLPMVPLPVSVHTLLSFSLLSLLLPCREKYNGQTIAGEYLSAMRGGGERQKCKRFLKSVAVSFLPTSFSCSLALLPSPSFRFQNSLDEGDMRAIRKSLNIDPPQDGAAPSTGVDKKAILETLCAKSPKRLIAARWVPFVSSVISSPATHSPQRDVRTPLRCQICRDFASLSWERSSALDDRFGTGLPRPRRSHGAD
jgi:hypothetical protein